MLSLVVLQRYIYKHRPYKKCIIFVPGFTGSQLFYNGIDNKFYKKGEALLYRNCDNLSISTELVKDTIKLIKHSDMFLCDGNGIPADHNVGLLCDKLAADERDRLLNKYGTLCMFKNFINELNDKFGLTTAYKNDIIMFNYDWRLDCSYNARLLIKKIIDYDEVVLIAYSLGGLVASKAFAIMQREYSLKNIKTYLSVCVPYNGTIKALRGLKTGYMEYGFLSGILYDTFSISNIIQKLSRTFPSIYQLLPTNEFFRRNKGFLKDNDNKEMTYFDMLNYLKDKLNLSTSMINKAIEFHNSLFIDNKHILDYINEKYFFVGTGFTSPSSIQLHNKSTDIVPLKYSEGDNTVDLYHSAVPPISNTKNLKFYKIKTLHSEIFDNYDFLEKIIYIIQQTVMRNQ